MTSTGRRLDTIWIYYKKISVGNQKLEKVKCLKCNKEVTALVARMKKHLMDNHGFPINGTSKYLYLN